MRVRFLLAGLLALSAAGCPGPTSGPGGGPGEAVDSPMRQWPRFRGPGLGGEAPAAGQPPVRIDLARHVRFDVKVPADGQSSPIIWGDRIYLTGEGERIMAFDRQTGRLIWDTALKAPPPTSMPGDEDFRENLEDTGTAAPTPCTDGRRIYAFFGTGVLGCVDPAGRQVWADRIIVGKPRNSFGLAASPVLCGDLLVQVADMGVEPEDGLSFIAAARAADGVEVWRQDRPVRSSWSTPLLVRRAAGDELVTNAQPYAIAYDAKTGQELWRAEELSGDVAASPVAAGDVIFAPGGEGGELLAIRPGGKGDVTKTHVLWDKKIPMPDVASPVCTADRYIHVSSGGDVFCLAPATGKGLWQADLKGPFWASPVLAGPHLYLINYDGLMTVLAAETGEVLSQTKLGQKTTASPAILDGRIYIRTADRLICLGEP